MKVIESEAIILKNFSLAEADKIILCLAQKAGLVRLSVRGAKRLKSRFGGQLEPFTIAAIIYGQKEETELGRLFQAEISASHFHLSANLNVLNALSYLSEILIAITPAQEPNETLYRMVRACLLAINEARGDLAEVRLIVTYFELWLLRLAGFLPDFRVCSKCQSSILNTRVYYFADEFKLVCQSCANQNSKNELMPQPLLKALRAALVMPPLKFAAQAKKMEISHFSLEPITHRLLRRTLDYLPHYWSSDYYLENNPVETIANVG